MSTWRGASNGAARGVSTPFASGDTRGRGRGRGGAAPRGAGRGAAGSSAFPRSSNLSWRAPAAAQPSAEDQDGMDEGDEGEQAEHDESDEPDQPAPSAFPAFGSAPSAFGTPAFTGGSSGGALSGGASVFGGAAPKTAFSGSAFGAASTAFSGSAFGAVSNPSAFSSTPAPAPSSAAEAPPSKPTPNQISTLEVLGEDSESRKKRFESSLANNRYLELKPLREAQRARDIKSGLIPDPLKPMRLDQATDFLGTCEEMCPEWEREEREYQNNVDLLERYPGTNRIDPGRAVKAFHRPAAGNDQPLPSDVRPPHILKSTLDYLFHTLLPTQPLHVTHPFLRDRTRAIRQDFTMQNERGVVAIECNERIARYHVLALGALREQSGFSESQELEQLRKVLKSLNEFYDDARISDPPIPTPNEAEFRSYNILTHLRDPDIIWSTELLPSHVFEHPLLQTALSLHSLAQRSNIPRGERASPNAASRFFKLVSRADVPYLFGCILSTHFADIRKNALESMKNSYLHQHSLFPARTLAKVLGCDDEAEVVAVCGKLGLKTKTDDHSRLVVELHKAAVMKNGTITPHVSQRLVEAKRGSTSYQQVIDGDSYSSGPVDAMPPTPSISSAPSFAAPPPTSRPSRPTAAPTAFAPPSRAQPPASTRFSAPPAAAASPFAAFSAPLQPSAPPFAPSSAASAPNPFASVVATSTIAPPSLNPVAPSFVPTRPPLQRNPSPQPPPFFSAPTPVPQPPIPPVVEEPAPRSIKKLPPPVAAAPAPTPRKPSVVAPTTPPTPNIDRRPLIKALSAALTDELLRYVVQFPVRRAVEQALKERWELVRQRQQKGRRVLAERIASEVMEDFVQREVRRVVYEVSKRERKVLGDMFDEWRERTRRSIQRRKEEKERARRFEQVAGDIGSTAWREENEEDEMEDDELDMSSLSVGLGDVLPVGEPTRLDQTMAVKLKQAELDRERIWAPGTYLDIVCSRIDSAFSRQHLNSRPSWSVIITTPDVTSPFAAWLSCKFDLDEQTLSSTMDTGHADVEVQMVGEGASPSEEITNTAGLLVLDYSSSSPLQRAGLASLVAKVEQRSLFKPDLLVFTCPERTLTMSEEDERRSKILLDLDVSSLTGLKSTTILFIRLPEAEDQLDAALEAPLSEVAIHAERVLRPLSLFVEPLIRVWKEALQQASAESTTLDPHGLVAAFLDALNTVIDEARTAAKPVLPSLASLPSLGTGDSLFRAKVRPYIQRPAFASAGHFPFVDAQLSQRPPLSQVILAKLLLEHLGDFALTHLTEGTTTRQQALDEILPSAMQRLRTSLQSSVASLFPVENGVSSLSPKKKRKASLGPTLETINHKKRVEVSSRDSLSALEIIMRDARGLLA